jgi:ABC-type transport system involved in multi-copper enzyme maturation permease subunit
MKNKLVLFTVCLLSIPMLYSMEQPKSWLGSTMSFVKFLAGQNIQNSLATTNLKEETGNNENLESNPISAPINPESSGRKKKK